MLMLKSKKEKPLGPKHVGLDLPPGSGRKSCSLFSASRAFHLHFSEGFTPSVVGMFFDEYVLLHLDIYECVSQL